MYRELESKWRNEGLSTLKDGIHVQKTYYHAGLLQELLLQKEELTQQRIDTAKKLAEFKVFSSFLGI